MITNQYVTERTKMWYLNL